MELGLFILLALRLVIPLTIFRWPLYGGIASLVIDALDTNIVKLFGTEIPNYPETDKLLDMYYLSIEVFVSWKWSNHALRTTSMVLYIWRFVGVLLFEVTGVRWLLFAAPNIFEHFFLLVAFLYKRNSPLLQSPWFLSYKRIGLIVFLLWLTKIPQELVLHVYQVNAPIETFIEWLSSQLK